MSQQKSNYRTFEANGQTVIIDDFIHRRLFKDPDILPRRKYTFIRSINIRDGYPRIVLKSNGKVISLSKYIMHAGKDELIDHRNRNRLDNRRSNLRIATRRQNMLNRKIKNNTGLVGVSAYADRGYFYVKASFTISRKKRKVSAFYCPDTPFNRILAALAHDKFVLQAGDEEYAPLNFPCWQFEPFRSILMEEDLKKYKEKNNIKNQISKSKMTY